MPFLICDPMAAALVDRFLVEIDGNPIQVDGELAGDQVRLHYDVTDIETGSHTVRVAACNEWGDGEFSDPFEFEKALPGQVFGLGLSAD